MRQIVERTAQAVVLTEAWMTYTQWLNEECTVLAGDALLPVDTSTTVRVADGTALFTDGPFAETKDRTARTPVRPAQCAVQGLRVALLTGPQPFGPPCS